MGKGLDDLGNPDHQSDQFQDVWIDEGPSDTVNFPGFPAYLKTNPPSFKLVDCPLQVMKDRGYNQAIWVYGVVFFVHDEIEQEQAVNIARLFHFVVNNTGSVAYPMLDNNAPEGAALVSRLIHNNVAFVIALAESEETAEPLIEEEETATSLTLDLASQGLVGAREVALGHDFIFAEIDVEKESKIPLHSALGNIVKTVMSSWILRKMEEEGGIAQLASDKGMSKLSAIQSLVLQADMTLALTNDAAVSPLDEIILEILKVPAFANWMTAPVPFTLLDNLSPSMMLGWSAMVEDQPVLATVTTYLQRQGVEGGDLEASLMMSWPWKTKAKMASECPILVDFLKNEVKLSTQIPAEVYDEFLKPEETEVSRMPSAAPPPPPPPPPPPSGPVTVNKTD
ncbi:hypothetical protein [Spongorhabdus nitratireducens]